MILMAWWPLTWCSSLGRPHPPQWEQSGERDLSSWTFLTFFIKTCWKKWFRISACSKHNCAKPATCTLTFSIIMHSFGRYKVILLQFFTKYYYIVHCINDKRFLLYIPIISKSCLSIFKPFYSTILYPDRKVSLVLRWLKQLGPDCSAGEAILIK